MTETIGLDIVDVERIAHDLDAYGDRFIDRLLGDEERVLLTGRQNRAEFVAGRLAAKEALIKALAPYLDSRPPYAEMQFVNDAGGAPMPLLSERVELGLKGRRVLVSISHERRFAAAVVLIKTDD